MSLRGAHLGAERADADVALEEGLGHGARGVHHARLGRSVDGGEGHGEETAGARHGDEDALPPLPPPAGGGHGLAGQADAVQHRAQIDVQGGAPGVVLCTEQVA